MNIENSVLYRTLKRQVRKQDHPDLLRMLQLVADSSRPEGDFDPECELLAGAFLWKSTPQGHAYWQELSDRMRAAGHPYY